MLAQPSDTPTDTTALEQELAELRQSLARLKYISIAGVIAFASYAGVAGGYNIYALVAADSEATERVLGGMIVAGFILAVAAPVTGWRGVHVLYQISQRQLAWFGTARQQNDFARKLRLLFGLGRVLLIFMAVQYVILLTGASFGYRDQLDLAELFGLKLNCAASLGSAALLVAVVYLGGQLKPIQQQLDAAEKAATPAGGGHHARSAD